MRTFILTHIAANERDRRFRSTPLATGLLPGSCPYPTPTQSRECAYMLFFQSVEIGFPKGVPDRPMTMLTGCHKSPGGCQVTRELSFPWRNHNFLRLPGCYQRDGFWLKMVASTETVKP